MKQKHLKRWFFIFMVLGLLAPSYAFANLCIPLVVVLWPIMIWAIIPIIIIESIVLYQQVEITFWHSAGITSAANIVSTLIGIPITAIILWITSGIISSMLQIIDTADSIWKKFLTQAWYTAFVASGDGDKYEEMITSFVIMVLLVPFFFGSWFVECNVVYYMLDEFDRQKVQEALFLGNLVTYGILEVIAFGLLIYEWQKCSTDSNSRIIWFAEKYPTWDENRIFEEFTDGFISIARVRQVLRRHNLKAKVKPSIRTEGMNNKSAKMNLTKNQVQVLEKGADVNQKNNDGGTALTVASGVEVLKLLKGK